MKKPPPPSDLLEGVDLKRLLDHLHFDEEQSVQAAADQASLYFEATKLQTNAMQRRLKAQRRLAILQASLLLQFRQIAIAGGEKLSSQILNAQVLSDPSYLQARRRLETALGDEATAKMLVAAYRQRRDALKIVGEQNRAEFGTLRKVQDLDHIRGLREQLRKKYPGMQEEEK